MSRFKYQWIALDILFKMRYDSIPYSNKQPSDSLRAEATTVFTSLQYCCFVSCLCLGCSGVDQHTWPFWSVTVKPVGAQKTTLYQMRGDIHGFHMRYANMDLEVTELQNLCSFKCPMPRKFSRFRLRLLVLFILLWASQWSDTSAVVIHIYHRVKDLLSIY